MKKLIPFLVLLLGVTGAVAQTVDFRNNQTDFPAPAADRDVYNLDMTTPLVGTNFQARLLYGTDASSLQPATYVTPARFRNVTPGALLAGTWQGGARTLVGFAAGHTVTLVVQAWDAGDGTIRFEDAAIRGQSDPFSYTIAAPGSAPTAFYMSNFRSFSLVPEPSVIGLGLIGVGALFLLRRRKA